MNPSVFPSPRVATALAVVLASAVLSLGAMSGLAGARYPAGATGRPAGRAFRLDEAARWNKARLIRSHVPGVMLVRFRRGTSLKTRRGLRIAAGGIASRKLTGASAYVVKLRPGVQLADALARYRASSRVTEASPDYFRVLDATPDDTYYASRQWNMRKVRAERAWDLVKDASRTVVGVLDSGLDFGHPDLDGNVWTNVAEVGGVAGVDDDGNGYKDDIRGWTFAGVSQYMSDIASALGTSDDDQSFAQSFVARAERSDSAAVGLARVGKPVVPITMALRASPLGSDIATATISASRVASGGLSMVEADWNEGSIATTPGSTYYLVVETDNLSSANYYRLYMSGPSHGRVYPDGSLWAFEYGSWQPYAGWDMVFDVPGGGGDASDRNGHGTRVAGIVAAETNNREGVAGLAGGWGDGQGARLMALRVSNDQGIAKDSDIIDAVHYASDNGAKVVNMSFSGEGDNALLAAALDDAYHGHDVFAVAAAGNQVVGAPFPFKAYPAAYPHVTAVAATTGQDARPAWSNYGSFVDLAAPGVQVFSTSYVNGGHGYAYGTGTSMAAPHVTGECAMLRSLLPTKTAAEVWLLMRSATRDLGTPGKDPYTGYGRINVVRALDASAPTVSNVSVSPGIFRPTAGKGAEVRYTIGDDRWSDLDVVTYIYNSAGRLVRRLGPFVKAVGANYSFWNGRDSSGRVVQAGTYRCRVKATDRAGNYAYGPSVPARVVR